MIEYRDVYKSFDVPVLNSQSERRIESEIASPKGAR
jgi:hypothetical protein